MDVAACSGAAFFEMRRDAYAGDSPFRGYRSVVFCLGLALDGYYPYAYFSILRGVILVSPKASLLMSLP